MRVILSAGKRIYFTLLASSFMFPVSAFAQCVDTQDCKTLGYTEISNSGNCLKCPFGEYWACPEEKCGTSYKYTCTGTNQKKPLTGACNEKYTFCNCAAGYEWNNGICSKTLPKCQIGYIYYTDDTCSLNLDSSKTPQGVVVYANPNGGGIGMVMPPFVAANNNLPDSAYTNHFYPYLSSSEYEYSCVSTKAGKFPSKAVAQSIINNADLIASTFLRLGSSSYRGGYFYTGTKVTGSTDLEPVWIFQFTMSTDMGDLFVQTNGPMQAGYSSNFGHWSCFSF